MAFLAPLFLAGLAVVALPILLHLRKNRPQQTVAFSTLMFLEPSPPVTRTRSKLQDLLLLILRALAVILLVLAFSRPFLPAKIAPPAAEAAALDFILLDTSASMQGAPAAEALKQAETLIDSLPADAVIATASYADALRLLVDPARARSLPAGERKSTARASLAAAVAGWQGTRLDLVLPAALAAAGSEGAVRLHLIGDLQKSPAFERLRGEVWPGSLQVVLHPIEPAAGWTNAGVRMLPVEKSRQRVRVTNSEGSAKSGFTLAWSGLAEVVPIAVPPGESAVFDAPPQAPAEGTVRLAGDDFPYDNEAAWTTPPLPVARVWHPGQALAADASEEAYFLNRALQSTPDYTVAITAEKPTAPPALTIASGGADLAKLLEAGSTVLFTLRDTTSARELAKLVGAPSGEAAEASVRGHALFGAIDFKSPVFAPFADARYSDFSTIRIWKYRILPAALVDRGQVAARFDSGDPAWITYPVGKGTLHVLTTTWRPADSQIALTPKFPALLHALLARSPDLAAPGSFRTVDDTFPTPGLHRENGRGIAVQLDPAESERTPLAEADFRALGLPLDPPPELAPDTEAAQALSDAEQESRQRFGWWLLIAAAVFFLAETLYAGFAGKRPVPASP